MQIEGQKRMLRRMYQGLEALIVIYHNLLITPLQLSTHADDEHVCSARVHACGEVRYLKVMVAVIKPPLAL